MDTLMMLCGRCRAVLDGRKDDPRTLRFLELAIWGEHPLMAERAVAVLRTLDAEWARAALEAFDEASA